jgi:hypothetical protein
MIAAIEVAPVFCDMCGWGPPDPANQVRILEITQLKDDWLAQGHLAFSDYCPQCGDSYSVFVNTYPSSVQTLGVRSVVRVHQ